MFLILAYDVNSKRDAKYLNWTRKFLLHVQNSVFEGELTDSQFERLKKGIRRLMNHHKDEDSVVIYKFKAKKYLERESIGVETIHMDNFII